MKKTNEAVYRSPKWLRNFLDYEISTGKDIKGEPSLRMKKKLAEEKAERERKARWEEKAEEDRKEWEENRRKREQHRKEWEEKKRKHKAEEKEFNILFPLMMRYLADDYWKVNVVKDVYIDGDKLVVEFGAHHSVYKDINAVVGYFFRNNNKATFSVKLTCGNGKVFNYRASGSGYIQYAHTMTIVLKWWKDSGKSTTKGGEQQQSSGNYDQGYQAPPPRQPKQKVNEKDPVKNRERRLNLLKDTLAGYERELARCKDPGRISELKIEINNIKGRIKVMEQPRTYENFKHVMSFQIFEKQFTPIKDDYVMITYALTGEPVPARIVKVYPNNTYLVSFDVEGSTARGAPEATIRNSDIISPYKPIRSPVGSGFISANTNFQVRNTSNVNQVSNDMYL